MSLECVEWECEITVLSEYSFLPGFGGGRNLYAGALSIYAFLQVGQCQCYDGREGGTKALAWWLSFVGDALIVQGLGG